MKRYLLIISCSNSKNHQEGLIPAIRRYTGAWYGVINKLKREGKFPSNVDVLIISAKYGLIRLNDLIEDYNWKMDVSRAKELNESVIEKLKVILIKTDYESVLINMGRDYMEAMQGFEGVMLPLHKAFVLKGRIGYRKKEMRNWLLSIWET